MAPASLSRLLARAATGLALAAACLAAAAAGRIEIVSAEILRADPGEDPGIYLSASADIELPQSMEDSLRRGLTLHFLTEVRIHRARWYWADETVAEATRDTRLSFNPLTRTYKVFRNGLSLSFQTLDEALGQIRTTAGWMVCPEGAIDAPDLSGQMRIRLDTSQLPKIFQMTVIRNKDWILESGWRSLQLPARRTK